MNFSAIVLFSLLSSANAVGLGSIRGEEQDQQIDFACTLKGSTSQDTCDATTAQDGTSCVWCSYVSYGVCVSEDVAEQMKETIPGLTCDDDTNDDDDNAPSDDDSVDDDTAPTDDSVPDDYWNCLEKYSTSAECIAAGCSWCDNKGGYGVCFDVETAKDFENSDWYSCTIPSSFEPPKPPLKDPTDPSCLIATIGGDESVCTSMVDGEGKHCDWCSFQGFDFCVNGDQAELAKQYGASCGEDAKEETNAFGEKHNLFDPSDPACLMQTITGDESSCKAATDVDGKPCDWCSFQGYEFCVNVDQAQIVETYGADCGDRFEEEDEKATKVRDPSDFTCLLATLTGDESTCKSSNDADGNPCDWCSFQGYDFCVNDDQAQLVEMYGADCTDRSHQQEEKVVTDPSDPSCLVVTIGGGDESSCKAAKDMEGNSCEWCSFQGYDVCLNDEQAQVVKQYGASCDEETVNNVSTSVA